MVKIEMIYEGDLHCRLTHGPSGKEIVTDAPKDNQGRGEAFSPTDLVAAALGSCLLTVIGIASRTQGINMKGATATVEKEMITTPFRRIGKITVNIHMPAGINIEKRAILEAASHTCPVQRSLNAGVETPINIIYPD